MSKLCIVIPCYNEEKRINLSVFGPFISANPGVDFLFINDGSTDKTLHILNGFAGLHHDRVKVLDLQENSGKAEAVRLGMLKAFDFNHQYVAYWDADLATPITEIPRFLKILNEKPDIKFILGMRIVRLGANVRRIWYRHYLGRVFATMASLILKLHVYDTQCGAKIICRDMIPFVFKDFFVTKWFFDVEILFRIKNTEIFKKNHNILYELPLAEWYDASGSKLGLMDFIRAPFELFKIHRHYKNLSNN
ncbi:MAG: glycosyltransferase [Bacteriovoracaceae bacterium]|nr:glycosyltransferase [Bacteriovoracaceae bacterium]